MVGVPAALTAAVIGVAAVVVRVAVVIGVAVIGVAALVSGIPDPYPIQEHSFFAFTQ